MHVPVQTCATRNQVGLSLRWKCRYNSFTLKTDAGPPLAVFIGLLLACCFGLLEVQLSLGLGKVSRVPSSSSSSSVPLLSKS